MRNFQLPGRSPVRSPYGMAATSHPLSSQVAIDILKAGGNAMDAAIAACAVQCVVEPASTGIGGDCFCIYSPEGSCDLLAYNGSGRAPMNASTAWYEKQGIADIPRQSPHAVTIPGAVDAWDRLVKDHGRLTLGELLQPAIQYARDGYPISSRVAFDIASQVALLAKDEHAKDAFLKDGKPPQEGRLHHQPRLASTLDIIAKHGRDGFYSGVIADDIVSYLQSKGGLHTAEDFEDASGEYVSPISTDYKGYQIYECPPNGQGLIALLLLNIIKGVDLGNEGPLTIDRAHHEIEAARLAYRDRNCYLADTDFSKVPVDWLLSKTHADELRASINPSRASTNFPIFTAPNHSSTVYITVVDKDRNCCSFINSLFDSFGSGLMAPKSGVMLQNRAQGFTLDPGHPNSIAPGKRPLHTIIPGMLGQNDKIIMPFGVMGGQYQAFGHMQFLTRLINDGLDIQQAQDMPRFFPDPFSDIVDLEQGIPETIVQGLKDLGHNVNIVNKPIGGSQAIWIDWKNGVLSGGSDPRKDGCAIAY